jgi:hypothetical protein
MNLFINFWKFPRTAGTMHIVWKPHTSLRYYARVQKGTERQGRGLSFFLESSFITSRTGWTQLETSVKGSYEHCQWLGIVSEPHHVFSSLFLLLLGCPHFPTHILGEHANKVRQAFVLSFQNSLSQLPTRYLFSLPLWQPLVDNKGSEFMVTTRKSLSGGNAEPGLSPFGVLTCLILTTICGRHY